MISREASRFGAVALCRVTTVALAALILGGCVGAGVGVSAGYYGPYDYDYDYDYAPCAPDYYVGPPVVVGGVVVHDHDRGRDRGGDRGHAAPHYRAPAKGRHVPSIPSRSRPH